MSQGKTEQARRDLSATGIVKLAEKVQVRLFHTPGLEPFASFWVKDHWETAHVKSAAFEDWLSAMCFTIWARRPLKGPLWRPDGIRRSRPLQWS